MTLILFLVGYAITLAGLLPLADYFESPNYIILSSILYVLVWFAIIFATNN